VPGVTSVSSVGWGRESNIGEITCVCTGARESVSLPAVRTAKIIRKANARSPVQGTETKRTGRVRSRRYRCCDSSSPCSCGGDGDSNPEETLGVGSASAARPNHQETNGMSDGADPAKEQQLVRHNPCLQAGRQLREVERVQCSMARRKRRPRLEVSSVTGISPTVVSRSTRR
jgi:hypothetical protein